MRLSDRRRSHQRTARMESFEARELLSAAPTYDFWIGDQHFPETGLYAEVNPAMTNAHALTGLDQARAAYGFTGAGQTVAVIDTGIAYTHDALGGGYGPGYRVVGGWDFTKGSPDAFDAGPYGSHGTHVAGIIGSSDGVYPGVAPEVDLVALRVFDDNGAGYFSWVEQALWWVHENRFAFENPITAVNLSLGASYNSASVPSWAMLEDALAQLKADGIFVAVAAGNSFAQYGVPGLSYPAVSPYVVPVGSVDTSGAMSSFSQRHTRMIAAPGQSIMSTVPDYMGNHNGIDDDFARYSGTSMATPYVAGASVLLREAYAFAGVDNVNQAALYNLMVTTADTLFDTATEQTYDRLNLQSAMDAIMPADDYGSTARTAHAMGTLTDTLSLAGHISRLDDVDWFQFTAGRTGTVTVTANPTLNLVPEWSTTGFAFVASNGGESITFDVTAGHTYRFGLATADGLGHYSLSVGLNGGDSPGTLLDVQTADVTGNGLADIVGRSAHDGTWWVAVNHGNGIFTNERWGRWNSHVAWVDVVAGDFNGDGKADIAGRNADTGAWQVALSNGTRFHSRRWETWNPAVTWNDVMVGDFNGDGNDDLVARVKETGTVRVAVSNGTRFHSRRWQTWNPAVTWDDVLVGDFNGDGKDDLVARVKETGTVRVAVSNGARFHSRRWETWNPAVTWDDVRVGDFNGDGKADLVARIGGEGGNGSIRVSVSNGARFNSSRWETWNPAVTWQDVRVGDFNNDGRADLVTRVQETGAVRVSLSSGTRFNTTRWETWNPNAAWEDFLVGDFNGNGQSDIVGCDTGSDDWWIGESNGADGFATQWWGRSSAPAGWEHLAASDYASGATSLRDDEGLAARSAALIDAVVHRTALDASADTLRSGRIGSLKIGAAAQLAGGQTSALPGIVPSERIALLRRVLDELGCLPGCGHADEELPHVAPATGADWWSADPGEDNALPGWEVLFDDPSPAAAALDAFFEALD